MTSFEVFSFFNNSSNKKVFEFALTHVFSPFLADTAEWQPPVAAPLKGALSREIDGFFTRFMFSL